jgi:hypothetical protein
MQERSLSKKFSTIVSHPVWALVAAFGTYFCMYGFRKPYTAATYSTESFFGIDYKFILIISQTLGYVIAKWAGIKIVSEIKRARRIKAILILIGFAELTLLLFGLVQHPWDILCLLLNGMSLGVIFGLVIGFLEGRRNTEFLIAGLCASFIVSDGVSKSVGTTLLNLGVSENWMPFFAGCVFMIPTLLFVAMLSVTPPQSAADIATRSARKPMQATDRKYFFKKYAPGLIGVTLVYLFVTLLRSVRADFAVELWTGLGFHQTPALFTQSELFVSLGVILIIGLAVLMVNNRKAFYFSLLICFIGFVVLLLSVAGLHQGMDPFTFMVLIGLGVYMPYVAVHAIVFERLIAITREPANLGFLMYIVDSAGYTGYIILMLLHYFSPPGDSLLSIFLSVAVYLAIAGGIIILFCYLYFISKLKNVESTIAVISTRQSSYIS